MIKVLLVDDETIARINLRCLINWEKEGYVICGEADNGLEALKKVEELNPEIIFTDMNMVGMNGVEFIKNVRKISTSARIIAYSAFDDFEFVRQSLKEGALDYLVKHKLDAKTLLLILNTVKENIKIENIEKQRTDRIVAMATSGKVLIQKNVLINLLNGYVQENFDNIMKEYEINLDGKNLIVAVAHVDNYYLLKDKFSSQEFAVFLETIENILLNICTEIGKTEFLYMEDGKFTFIMSFAGTTSEAQINLKALSNLSNINGMVKRFLNITMSFGVSTICPSFTKLSDYYKEAAQVLESGYYRGSGYIVQKSELQNESLDSFCNGLSVIDEKNIILSIRGLKRENVMHQLDEIFKNMKEKKVSYNGVKIISVELINILERMIKESGITENSVYSSINLYEESTKFRTIDELGIWFVRLYNILMDVIERSNLGIGRSPIIKKAVEFILKNYNKDISLSEVSQYIDVSPQYLSKLFKDECGKGFVIYLNFIRIEQAKILLNQGVRVKDLAEKIGFNNYTYFFTVFKAITGMTPQQYEKEVVTKL